MITRIILFLSVVVSVCSLSADSVIRCDDLNEVVTFIKKSSVKPEERLIVCAVNNVVLKCLPLKDQAVAKGYDVVYDISNANAIKQANAAYTQWLNSGSYQLIAPEGAQTAYAVSQLRALGDFVFMTSRPFSCHDITIKQLKHVGISMAPSGPGNMVIVQGPIEGVPDELCIMPDRRIIYCANGSKKIAMVHFLAKCSTAMYKEVVIIEDKLDDINEVAAGCTSIPTHYAILYHCGGRQIEEVLDDKAAVPN